MESSAASPTRFRHPSCPGVPCIASASTTWSSLMARTRCFAPISWRSNLDDPVRSLQPDSLQECGALRPDIRSDVLEQRKLPACQAVTAADEGAVGAHLSPARG